MLKLAVWSRLLWDLGYALFHRDVETCRAESGTLHTYLVSCERRAGHRGQHACDTDDLLGVWA